MPQNPSLDQALPELRAAEQRLRLAASNAGISYTLADWGGMRTQADTTLLMQYRQADYAKDVRANPRVALTPIDTYRPIAPFGRSMHNWGSAFDVRITGAPPGVSASRALAILGTLAPTVGLRWGGTFPPSRLDPPHFELPTSVVDARARYLQYTNGQGYVAPSGPLDFIRDLILPRPQAATVPEPTLVLPGIEVTPSSEPSLDLGPASAAELPEDSSEVQAPTSPPLRQSQRLPVRRPQGSSARVLPPRAGVPMTAQEIKRRQQLLIVAAIFVGTVVVVLLRNSDD